MAVFEYQNQAIINVTVFKRWTSLFVILTLAIGLVVCHMTKSKSFSMCLFLRAGLGVRLIVVFVWRIGEGNRHIGDPQHRYVAALHAV